MISLRCPDACFKISFMKHMMGDTLLPGSGWQSGSLSPTLGPIQDTPLQMQTAAIGMQVPIS